MEKINLDDSLRTALVELQEYLALQLRYNKMLLAKRLGEVFSYFTLFMLLLGISGFLLFFLSFAFVAWFNQVVESKYMGHLVVSGFYLIIIFLLFLLRKPLIFNPIRKFFGEIFVGEESQYPEDILSFRTKEKLSINLKKHKQDIDVKEQELRDIFTTLGNQLTISNIIQTVAINAYSTFVTTSNIAKMAYSLVKKITSRKSKSNKRRKKSNKQIENGDD